MTSHVSFDHERPPRSEATYLREDERFVLHGVPWETYVALRDTLGERSGSGVRMTYLKGTLELMSPSRNHEDYKKIIARLVEAYAEENDLDLRGFGAMTFRRKARKRGLEPDECYSLGRMGKRPDIAIEVVVSTSLVDKLAVYEGLEVPEVWQWEDGKLTVQRLRWGETPQTPRPSRLGARGYEPRPRSEVLPGLDLDHLAGFVVLDANQTQQVKAYRRSLRAQGG